jgi:hypothetical protein
MTKGTVQEFRRVRRVRREEKKNDCPQAKGKKMGKVDEQRTLPRGEEEGKEERKRGRERGEREKEGNTTASGGVCVKGNGK